MTGYDARNRLREHTVHYVPGGLTLTSTCNRFGERSQLDLEQGAETLTHSWTYDALGRLDTATFPGSSAIDFTPRPDDSVQTIVRASGVATNYAYFAQGPADTITVTARVIGQQSRLDYAPLNPVQNITGLTEQYRSSDPSHGYSYGYDGGNRLTSANYPAAYGLPADEAFGYDLAGNREIPGSPSLYDYDANNRITVSPGFASYGFDADGNLTARTGETFTYDASHRLRSFAKSGTAASYAYDPFGRRIKKTVNGVTTWTVWDGDQRLAEYDGSGDRTVRYAYAGGFAPTQVAYANGASEDVYDVHTDHLDTPRLLTDSSGTAVWRAAYAAFGAAQISTDPDGSVVTPDPGIGFQVRFPGQYFDAETGLHDNLHRYYSPELGRYISADPIGQYGRLAREGIAMSRVVLPPTGPRPLPLLSGSNLFEYARANPVRMIDPSGEGPITFGVCVAIGAGITAKQAYDAYSLGQDAQAVRDQISALQAQHDAECDPAKQLKLLAQIQDLTKQFAVRNLKAQANAQAAAVAGLAATACIPLIAIGP